MVDTKLKDKVNFWKNKTKVANREKKNLSRKNRGLTARVAKLVSERKALKQEVRELRKRVSEPASVSIDTSKAARHWYSLVLVLYVIQCQRFGATSLRSCQNMVRQLILAFGLRLRVPSHTTIRNWVCKCGYHRSVAGKGWSAEDADASWVLWVDESIVVGGQKVLLVLGRVATNWAFDTNVTHATVHVRYLGYAEQWLATDVAVVLQDIEKVDKVAYVVSDCGHNLVKSYQIGGFNHVSDLSHAIANSLERHYKADEAFITCFTACTALRKKWSMNKTKGAYIPPCQRSKVRFANIFPTIEWAHKMIPKFSQLPDDIQTELSFLQTNEALFNELYEVHKVIGQICHVLKVGGFSAQNKAQVEIYLATLSDQPRLNAFASEVHKWLERTETVRQNIGLEVIFCCSDIIESTFGRFKQKINTHSSFGMTEFVLTIATFGQDFSKEEIRAALEQNTLQQIADWRPKCESVFHKKRNFFKSKNV